MSGHTPGPWWWRVGPKETGKRWGMAELIGTSPDSNADLICDFGKGDDQESCGEPPNEWDRALIAAAPDLLAACEAAEHALSCMDLLSFETVRLLRAAIAKAKGAP